MIGLIGNFKERVKKKKKKKKEKCWRWKNLKEMSFSREFTFLKYKVLLNFKPFSVPFEANLLLQKCQQFSFLAPLKGLGNFYLLNVFKRKCGARKLFQTNKQMRK